MGVNCLIFSGNTEYDLRMLTVGPYRIATELRDRGYTVQVIDLSSYRTFTKIHELILKKFVDKDTLWIGFSINFCSHIIGWPGTDNPQLLSHLKQKNPLLDNELRKFIDFAKTLNPKVEFLTGGVRAYDLSHLGFYHFRGYADESIIKFTDSLCRGNKPIQKNYQYDVYDNFITSKTKFEKNDIVNYYKSLTMEISRGCIFRCKFCAFPLNGKTKGEWIKRTNNLLEEFIFNYENYGVTDYVFADDTFNDSPQKLELLYNDVFSKLPFKLTFSTYMRLDLLYRYPHTLDLLKESGLDTCCIGIETKNEEAAKIIGKGMSPTKQIEFVEKIKSEQFRDVTILSGWIFGLPTDTKESIIESAKWILSKNNPIDHNYISHLSLSHSSSYRSYRSPFDLNADSYGVKIYLDETGYPQWYYENKDLTSQWCTKFAQEVYVLEQKTWVNKKIQTFRRGLYINAGVKKEDIKSLTYSEIDKKYDLKSTENRMNSSYLRNILML